MFPQCDIKLVDYAPISAINLAYSASSLSALAVVSFPLAGGNGSSGSSKSVSSIVSSTSVGFGVCVLELVKLVVVGFPYCSLYNFIISKEYDSDKDHNKILIDMGKNNSFDDNKFKLIGTTFSLAYKKTNEKIKINGYYIIHINKHLSHITSYYCYGKLLEEASNENVNDFFKN